MEAGRSEDVIGLVLLKQGWTKEQVDEAINFVKNQSGGEPKAPPAPPAPGGGSAIPPTSNISMGGSYGVAPPIESLGAAGDGYRLPRLGKLFKETFRVYKSRFWTLILLTFLALIIPTIVGLVSAGGFVAFIILGFSLIQKFGTAILLILSLAALGVGVLISWFSSRISMSLLAAAFYADEKIGIGESWRRSRGKGWTWLWTGALLGLIAGGGLILGIVPGIFLVFAFSLAGVVLLVENQKYFSAILRSRDLTRGHWWYVFGLMFELALVVLVIGIVVSFIPYIKILSQFVGFVLSPLYVVASVLLYKNLKLLSPAFTPSSTGRKLKYGLLILVIPTLIILLWNTALGSILVQRLRPNQTTLPQVPYISLATPYVLPLTSTTTQSNSVGQPVVQNEFRPYTHTDKNIQYSFTVPANIMITEASDTGLVAPIYEVQLFDGKQGGARAYVNAIVAGPYGFASQGLTPDSTAKAVIQFDKPYFINPVEKDFSGSPGISGKEITDSSGSWLIVLFGKNPSGVEVMVVTSFESAISATALRGLGANSQALGEQIARTFQILK